jgi:ribosomal protein L11 methylase PrmA
LNEISSGSFRDPKGHIFIKDGEIFRTITVAGIEDYEAVKKVGFYDDLVSQGLLVPYEEVGELIGEEIGEAKIRKVLKHPGLDFISYPYEWSFSALKAAALFHLEIQIKALKKGIVTSDATAYNIHFDGPDPIFIDHLSFRPYREGEYWLGHRQFCEQFITPLLLQAYSGISFHAWYRGSLEGISISDSYRLLPWRAFLSPTILTHIILPAFLENKYRTLGNKAVSSRIKRRSFPKGSYLGMLRSLHAFMAKLQPHKKTRTIWHDYEQNNIYDASEAGLKREFITTFVKKVKPAVLWDIGCNTGVYAQAALEAGAGKVIGFENDTGALELSFERAKRYKLDFLPLFLDLANPAPSQGWNQNERQGFYQRRNANALIALAVIHHLSIGRNVPLEAVLSWLLPIAPVGVVEFVPKTDPMVQELLALREDIFIRYTEDIFLSVVSRFADIVKSEKVTKTGRILVWYERR